MKKCRIDKYLVPGEEVIYRAKISKMTFLTEFILSVGALAVILFGIYASLSLITYDSRDFFIELSELIEELKNVDNIVDEEFFFLSIIVFLSVFVPVFPFFIHHFNWMLRNLNREGVVTKERVLWFDTSYFRDYFFDFSLSEIKEVISKQTFMGKIFNYAEIYIGTGNETVGLDGFKDYVNYLRIIKDMVKESKNPTPKIDKIEKFI